MNLQRGKGVTILKSFEKKRIADYSLLEKHTGYEAKDIYNSNAYRGNNNNDLNIDWIKK